MRCKERNRLIALYKAAVSHYSATVDDLNLASGKTSKQEYDRLLALSERDRASAEAALLALGDHTRKHGC